MRWTAPVPAGSRGSWGAWSAADLAELSCCAHAAAVLQDLLPVPHTLPAGLSTEEAVAGREWPVLVGSGSRLVPRPSPDGAPPGRADHVDAVPTARRGHRRRLHRAPARTHLCFAQVAVAAALTMRDAVIEEARTGLVDRADRPVRARAAEQALTGAEFGSPPPVTGCPTNACSCARAVSPQNRTPQPRPSRTPLWSTDGMPSRCWSAERFDRPRKESPREDHAQGQR